MARRGLLRLDAFLVADPVMRSLAADLPGIGPRQPRQHSQKGRLPRTIGAAQNDGFTGRQRQAYPPKKDALAPLDGEAVGREQGGGRNSHGCRLILFGIPCKRGLAPLLTL